MRFRAVRYPILPKIRLAGSRQAREQILEIRHSSLYCPRDFDISPYFNVVKPTIAQGFDYKALQWADLSRAPDDATQASLAPQSDSGGDVDVIAASSPPDRPLVLADGRRYLCRSRRLTMLDDAINAITQMFSPPLRAVLWKSIVLALALIVVLGIALDRLIVHLVGAGGASVETDARAAGASAGRAPSPGCFRSPPASASSSAACC